jgi:hypothetical protein
MTKVTRTIKGILILSPVGRIANPTYDVVGRIANPAYDAVGRIADPTYDAVAWNANPAYDKSALQYEKGQSSHYFT